MCTQTTGTGETGKSAEVQSILRSLQDGQCEDYPHLDYLPLLQRLKVLGRQPQDADAIFTLQGIQALCHFGLNRKNIEISREALGCLANATLLRPATRQIIVDSGQAARISELYREATAIEDTFLCARLLLMLTDRTNLNLAALLTDEGLADAISLSIEAHSLDPRPGGFVDRPGGPSKDMALSETLKLLYSVISSSQSNTNSFKPSIGPIVSILTQEAAHTSTPMEPPINHLINALFGLHLDTDDTVLFPARDPLSLVQALINILRQTIISYPESALDLAAAPTLGLLSELYKLAPEHVRVVLQENLLPQDDERNRPLGQSETLPARLLRLSTSSQTPELRKVIPVVLFEMSGRDAKTFVKNVGYGFASGFLTNNKIPHPRHPDQKMSSNNTESDVNFVTGQYVSEEAPSSDPPMSEAEKLQEAERLFVLFERLKKTGVMDVQNPVQEAVQSGRFEELE